MTFQVCAFRQENNIAVTDCFLFLEFLKDSSCFDYCTKLFRSEFYYLDCSFSSVHVMILRVKTISCKSVIPSS